MSDMNSDQSARRPHGRAPSDSAGAVSSSPRTDDDSLRARQPARPPTPPDDADELAMLLAPSPPTPSALEQAQELMYAAWEASGRTRVRLARKALSVSRDCADAYILLGDETARSLEDAKSLYEQGVRAGERALGSEAFARWTGQFWSVLETRPYMRACHALAESLWALGQSAEAIAQYRDMLRLNPHDNQGVRYQLARCLLETDDDRGLEDLLTQFREDASAHWVYTRALHTYRLERATFRAEVTLKAALCANHHVPDYLLGRKPLPAEMPQRMHFGGEDEAVCYADEYMAAWAQSDDALDWLAQHTVSPHTHRGH